ncbi:hypothetical protein [Blastomonas sp.]|uniref:hypothetical protein n=1 Tax=Blastomonas sp. TaxID=1909299 RepID=UPI003594555E
MALRSTAKRMFLVVALGMSSVAASAQDVGDWVLSPWQGSDVLFPGVIESRSGSVVTVRFDDGDVESRPADTVRPFTWTAGSKIACRWSDGEWYKATIRSISGDGYTMQIRYDDDGTVENTNTGRCRTR